MGVGAGQMSRVDSVKIAVMKAQSSLQRSVVASDAFFPFADGVEEAAKAGAVEVIQPGGSVRDNDVIAAADRLGMLYQSQGRFDDPIRVLSEAVTQVKGQSASMASRRRFLVVLYQQLGQLYRDTQNYAAAINTYEELGHLGDDEDRRARLLLMDTYRMHLRASEIQIDPNKMKLVTDPERVIAHVVALKAEEEKPAEVVAEGAVPAEPEVIKKGKKEVEGEEGAEAPAEKQEKKK